MSSHAPLRQSKSAVVRRVDTVEVPVWAVVSAFRYGLGRQSYIVRDTIDLVRQNLDALRSYGWDELVVSEIDGALRIGRAGADFDADGWRELRNEIFASWPDDVQASYARSMA